MASIAEQLAAAAVTDTLKGSPTEAEWPKLGWSNSRGSFGASGWKPPGYSPWPPTHSEGGAYYAASKLKGGNAYVYFRNPITYGLIGGAEYRSFSLWLFSGGGSAKPNGYQLRMQQVTSGPPKTYIFMLIKFVEEAETVLAEEAVAVETEGMFAIAKMSGLLSMYRKETAASAWVPVGAEIKDSSFVEGYSAIDGAGSNPTLDNFSTGLLEAPVPGKEPPLKKTPHRGLIMSGRQSQ